MDGVVIRTCMPGLDVVVREWADVFKLKPCPARADDNWDAYSYGQWLVRVTKYGDDKGGNTIELGSKVVDGVIPDWLEQLIKRFQEVYSVAQRIPPQVHITMVYVNLH